MTARVELVEIGPDDRALLDRLIQLYLHDFSEFDGSDVTDDARFAGVDLDRFFARAVRHAFLITVDGRIAGFALIVRDRAFRDDAEEIWWIEEFFVMRKYRRLGAGEHAATRLFDRFGGTWEIGQIAQNVPAQAFWRTIVGRYTGGDYEEFHLDDARWRGPVQYFHASTVRESRPERAR